MRTTVDIFHLCVVKCIHHSQNCGAIGRRSIVHADHKPHFSPTCGGDEWQPRWGSGDAPSGWVGAHNGPPTPLPCKGAPPAAKTAHRSNEDIARKRPSRRWKTSFTAVLNVPKEKSNLFSNRVQVWVKSICEQQQLQPLKPLSQPQRSPAE